MNHKQTAQSLPFILVQSVGHKPAADFRDFLATSVIGDGAVGIETYSDNYVGLVHLDLQAGYCPEHQGECPGKYGIVFLCFHPK